MSREIDGAIERKSPDYLRGYHDGYHDAYSKTLETFRKELEMAYLSRPIEMQVVCQRRRGGRISREIDVKIATEIMGHELSHENGWVTTFIGDGENRVPHTFSMLPHYSTNISAAMEVVNKLRQYHRIDGDPVTVVISAYGDGTSRVEIGRVQYDPKAVVANADTIPEAICLCALKAKGVEVEG